MATLIFVDQENSDHPAPKSQLKLPSGSCAKALGNVNKTEGVTSKMDKLKQKSQPCTIGLESCHTVPEEDWPEIENMFPLDPQDFESFDLPEEYKLSNIDLCGVPLMVFEKTYDRCVSMASSPVKMEEISWESNLLQSTADFLATLDEIIDMPPPIYDD
ncbi:hypothetical protein EK904_002187 [Melospiza melodia maxima]|nr:hypothetical protein EK904_002187 [Melospiza melodia maxima]